MSQMTEYYSLGRIKEVIGVYIYKVSSHVLNICFLSKIFSSNVGQPKLYFWNPWNFFSMMAHKLAKEILLVLLTMAQVPVYYKLILKDL